MIFRFEKSKFTIIDRLFHGNEIRNMKILFCIVVLTLGFTVNFAQISSIEAEFEQNKAKFKLEKFAEGEDASSGYDYLVYTKNGEVVKLREIWSSSYQPTFRAEDYFFRDGKLSIYVKYTFPKKYYKTSLKGANIPLKTVEKFYLTEGKLTVWIENGKTIPNTDKRWQETEKEILERANGQLENYERLKEEK